MLALLARNNL
jgi:hypothetical protein